MSTIKGDHYPACATWFGEECDCDAWKEAPVRDIREAMHPAPFVTADKFLSEDARRRALAYVPSEPLTPEIGFHFGEADASGVAMSPDCTHMLTRGSLVATLPDGSRVNLPAGTVLREDVDRCIGCGGTGRVETPEDGPEKCHDCYGDGRESTARLDLARDLLQRARIRLVDEPDAKKLDAEIVAFLAGASPPEPSARVALVLLMARSFVGKPGEGPEVNIEPLPPHLAALLAEHPRWSIADAERSIVDTTEGRDPPK